jgi:hypothetical protein
MENPDSHYDISPVHLASSSDLGHDAPSRYIQLQEDCMKQMHVSYTPNLTPCSGDSRFI